MERSVVKIPVKESKIEEERKKGKEERAGEKENVMRRKELRDKVKVLRVVVDGEGEESRGGDRSMFLYGLVPCCVLCVHNSQP